MFAIMTEIKSNEPEFSGQVVSWLNEFVCGGSYPFDVVTGETSIKSVGETTKFPDVQIWLNREAKQGFCGWETKPPTIRADDPVLLENAAAKARAMNADHFVTWNMRNAILWRTPQPLLPVSSTDRVKEYPAIVVSKPEDMWDKSIGARLKERAAEILGDLKTLYYDHTLHQIETDTTFFVGRLGKAVESLYPILREALIQRVGGDAKFRQALQAWGVKQGIANVTDAGFYQAVAKQIIYRLLVRILFYLTLQKQWREILPELGISGLSGKAATEHLKDIFAKARIIDWHAVFEEGLPDEIDMPDGAIHEIDALLIDLKRFSFGHMPHDVIGAVFEQLIPQPERHQLGQYFTPENLVDLILAFCIRERDDKVLDPTCGTGTFLLRAYNKKMRHLGLMDHKQLLPQIWGIDIAHFPAELATINLFRQNLSNYANFPRVIVKDFFDIRPDDAFDFPPPKADPASGITKIKEAIPQFDAAVGNFPFIRQELIEKLEKGYKDKLEKVIKGDWLSEYPEAFEISGNRDAVVAELKRNPDAVFNDVELNLSGQADIYAYLYFHTGRFIKEGGRMGFITSNSWLDVAYGFELQKYMVNNFKIVAILESRCEPWFEDAAVNTVATILERCSYKNKRDEHIVSFVKVKRKLAELIPWDSKLDSAKRWSGLDGLVHKIEAAADKQCYVIDGASRKCTLEGIDTAEDDDFRIRFVRQSDLKAQLDKEQKTAKWGHYLRTPDIYLEIMHESTVRFCSLDTVAEVNRGITSNNVEFFYLTDATIKHWNIEKEFVLSPVIYTPKEVPDISIDPSKMKFSLFVCDKPKKALIGSKALAYINAGEKRNFNNSLTFKGKEEWYSLGHVPSTPCSLFYARQGTKFRVALNSTGIPANDNLYTIAPKNSVKNDLLCALLNSFVFALGLEVNGRVNLGEGALKVQGFELGLTELPNPEEISEENKIAILAAFYKIYRRPIRDIFEEVKMKDRQQLDSLVLSAIGLDPAKYLKPLYFGLTELVRERIDLATMRKKQKQAKPVRDVENLRETVTQELTDQGIKAFPHEFLTVKPKPKDCVNIAVPDAPLKLGDYFMGRQKVTDGAGYEYDAPSTAAAKYIVYARKPGEYVVCLPYIENLAPVEADKAEALLSSTVQNYESYLKELLRKLNQDLLNRTFDHKQAEALSRRIFQDLGLPLIT